MRPGTFLLIAFCLFIQSCQKEPDVTLDDDPQLPAEEPVLLLRYVELDTTFSAPDDTLYQEFYTYDTEGRISKVVDYSYESGVAGDKREREFFYNGLDTLPSKVVEKWLEGNGVAYEAFEYYEYANGNLIYDSSLTFRGPANEHFSTTVVRYARVGSDVVISRQDYSLPDLTVIASEETSTVMQTLQNGNIISQESDGNSLFSLYKYVVATYDDKINPLYYVNVRLAYIDKWALQKNNTTMVKMGSDPANLDLIEETRYEYRPDGRPVIARIYEPLSDFTRKVLYFYND